MAQLLLRSNLAFLPTTTATASLQRFNLFSAVKTCKSHVNTNNNYMMSITTTAATRLCSTVGGGGDGNDDNNNNVGTAQDLSELFDLYHPPSKVNSVVFTPPTKTGETKSRSLVHKDGDWHRSVHIWLVEKTTTNYNNNNNSSSNNNPPKLLLQRRSSGKDTFPNCLDVSCAGHVTSGDNVDETAIRELEEELGVKDIDLHTIQKSKAFTIAASVEGETLKHGSFTCREYQEVYVLKCEDRLKVEDYAPEMEEEVAGFEVVNVEDVLKRLEEKEEELVPRSLEYVQALREAIFGGEKEEEEEKEEEKEVN